MIIPTKENINLNKSLINDIKKLLPSVTIIELREDIYGLNIYIKIPIVYHKYVERLDEVMPWLEKPRFHIHYYNIYCKNDSIDESLQILVDNISKLKWMESMYLSLDNIHIKGEVYPLSLLLNMVKLLKGDMYHITGIFNFEFIGNVYYQKLEKDLLDNIHKYLPNLQFIIANKKKYSPYFLIDKQYNFI